MPVIKIASSSQAWKTPRNLKTILRRQKKTIDLAIFSFTNDQLAGALLDAHARGVKVRIITDDEAMKGKGADT